MGETVLVGARFHGPPSSGNGGYVAGLVAKLLAVSSPGARGCEVTLRLPPPLDTPLEVMREAGELSLVHDGAEVARGRPAVPGVEPPPSPGWERAAEATKEYRGYTEHVFPGCFTCGPARRPGDGLRLFPGQVVPGLVAAPFVPEPDLAAGDGLIAEEFVWAALDCPSYWALERAGQLLAVLGRLTALVERRPSPAEPLVVAAWPLGVSGRKHRSASALYDRAGQLLARAEAVWIEARGAESSTVAP